MFCELWCWWVQVSVGWCLSVCVGAQSPGRRSGGTPLGPSGLFFSPGTVAVNVVVAIAQEHGHSLGGVANVWSPFPFSA